METSAEMTQQEKVMKYVKQYVLITLSISIMSVGVYFFKFPNNFVFGGVTGTAALVAKLTPMSASAFSSAANLVLLVVGLIFLGKEFAMTTGYATFVMSVELMVFEKLCPLSGPLSDQPMLDLLFAIALPAIASALLFNVGASSGGTDIIALIVEKYTHIHSIAVALFITDLFMVIAACFVFDLYTALYSFVGLTVKSLVIDAVLEKIKMCKAILIVCDEKKPICDFVMRKLMRGATYTPCFGAYTDKPHYIIYTTLTRHEADQLQEFIHKEHLNAFMSMLSTTEVFGKGFNHA
ncbi:MAG: YitT family protein [Faecalibacterium prausnitzii]